MSRGRYIPGKDAEFIEWSENLISVSNVRKTEWYLPEDKLAEVGARHIEAKTLYEKCQTAAYTKVDIEQKKEKMKLLRRLEEVFVKNNLQNNDAMMDAGQGGRSCEFRSMTRTPRPTASRAASSTLRSKRRTRAC